MSVKSCDRKPNDAEYVRNTNMLLYIFYFLN